MSEERAHADAGPSSSDMWIKCPASVTLTRGRHRKATFYTREGSAAHALAEMHLLGDPSAATIEEIDIEGETIPVGDEMREHVQAYTQFAELLRDTSTLFSVEKRVSLDWLYSPLPIPEPIFGTADIVAYDDSSSCLTVVDLKYGQGHAVRPVENSQLMIYALGALGEIKKVPEKIRITIFQPRAGETAAETWETGFYELMLWFTEVLKPAIQLVGENSTNENPGEHCRWCVRGGECASLARKAQQLAKAEFSPIPPEPDTFDNETLGSILDKAEIISTWVSKVRAEVSSRIDGGQSVPGWKLVDKRGLRKWKDPLYAENELSKYLNAPELFEPLSIKSPAQIEKALKKNRFSGEILDELVTRQSSGTTLVRDEDARQEVTRLAASSSFDKIDD